jgi:hypothetical protein
MFVENGSLIKGFDTSISIMQHMCSLLQTFHRQSFSAAAFVSHRNPSSAIQVIYTSVALLFFEFITSTINLEKFKISSQMIDPEFAKPHNSFPFPFFESQNSYFPNGFSPLPEKYFDESTPLTTFLDDSISNTTQAISDFLRASESSCTSAFLKKFLECVQDCSNEAVSLGCFAHFLPLLAGRSEQTITDIGFLNSLPEPIVDHRHILFCEGTLDPVFHCSSFNSKRMLFSN